MSVLVQVPSQSVFGAGQLAEQAPSTQNSPVAQAMSQPPQWAGSTSVSTQVPPHSMVPGPQTSTQEPISQASPEPQAMPQPPQ